MRFLLLTFFLIAATAGAFCQSSERQRDSLNHVVTIARNDRARAEALFALSALEESLSETRVTLLRQGVLLAVRARAPELIAKGYRMLAAALAVKSLTKVDSCLFFLNKADSICQRYQLTVEEAEALLTRAHITIEMGDYMNALTLSTRAANKAEMIGIRQLAGRAHVNLSRAFFNLDMDSTSLSYAQLALNELDTVADRKYTAKPLSLVGNIYIKQRKYKEALKFFERGRIIFDEFALYKEEAVTMSNIVAIYYLLGDIARHMAYNNELLLFARKHGLPQEANAETNIAYHCQSLNQWDSAYSHFEKSNKIWAAHGFANGVYVIDQMSAMGECLFRLNRNAEALKMLERAYSMALASGDFNTIKNALLELIEVCEKSGNLRSAFLYQKDLLKYSDSLQSKEKFQELARAEFKFDLEKAQREKKTMALQRQEAEDSVKRKNFEQLVLAFVLLLVLAAIGLLVRLYRQKLRANTELQLLNETISAQREELQTTLEYNEKMQEQLISSEKMASLGQLTAGKAHELNNPLNFINGGFGAIQDIYNELINALKNQGNISDDKALELDRELKQLMASVEKGIDRSTAIIRSLRMFSNPTTVVSNDSFSLRNCIDDALILLGGKIKSADVKIIFNTDANDTVLGNEPMINQVFVNLIDNAIAALEGVTRERQITITMRVAEEFMEVSIKDNGIGISKENTRNVMNPFFTTKEVGKGTGLGLSISYMTIQRHGGKISFTSEEGVGTEFVVALRRP